MIKNRESSMFDYHTAGGRFVPTKAQHDAAFEMLINELTSEQNDACNMVIHGYTCNEKVHHDYIHIVNEFIRHGL